MQKYFGHYLYILANGSCILLHLSTVLSYVRRFELNAVMSGVGQYCRHGSLVYLSHSVMSFDQNRYKLLAGSHPESVLGGNKINGCVLLVFVLTHKVRHSLITLRRKV